MSDLWGLWGLHTAGSGDESDHEDYRDSHQAPGPESGAPMHDVTQGIYPPGFYEEPFRYYGSDESTGDRDSWYTIHKVRGKPDAKVRIHRALPLEHTSRERGIGLKAPLNPGDWVTPSFDYAHEHGMSRFEGNTPWTVVTTTVPASQLHTSGDSLAEWGYNGPATHGYERETAAGKRKYRQQQVRKQQIRAETTKDFHHCGFCGSPSGEPCERGCWGKKKYPGERDVRGDTPGQPGVSGGGEIDYSPAALRDIRLSHTTSTDGIHYAHLVEADVAEDLRRLAMPWYHNTDAELNPGDEITPAAERGHQSRWSDIPTYDPNYVYVNHSDDDPINSGHHGRYRYEVEPVGDLQRDPEYLHNLELHREELNRPDDHPEGRWSEEDVPGYFDYMVPKARVVQMVGDYGDRTGDWATSKEASRLAAVTQGLVNRLSGEFDDWMEAQPADQFPQWGIGHWPNIEKFLKDRYPAAHRGLGMGMEEAQPLIDQQPTGLYGDPMPQGCDPYQTGPEAETRYGYDPKEIASGMLLLHNRTYGLGRMDMQETDENRLNDIAQKRYRMQRNYENRTAARTAMPAPMPSGVTELGEKWVNHERSRTAGQPLPKRFAAPDWDAVHQQGRADLKRLTGYLNDGIHADFDQAVPDIGKHPDAHQLLYTPHWAGQALALGGAGGFNKRVQARAQHYWNALDTVANHGPQHKVAPRTMAHQAAQAARDQFRVELQHDYHFTVPDLGSLSKLADPSEADYLTTVNPRYNHGLGGPSDAARDAYKINCQRSVLALDARKRGFNVEARPNFRPNFRTEHADDQLDDHDIANLWRDADGQPGQWTDVGDLPDLNAPEDFSGMTQKQIDQYLRGGGLTHHPMSENPSPRHWDLMERNIVAWGPGARAAIAPTKRRPGGLMRHVIYAEVGPDGKLIYGDPQDPAGAPHPGQDWRTDTAYGYSEGYTKLDRDDAASLYADPIMQIAHRNRKWSPLRYMRLDDKQLAPHAAKYLVDRGTADYQPITPPETR